MLALAIALVIMLVTVSGTLIAVLVASNQSAQSKVHVKYTSSDVNVKVEAKYYVGSTGTDMVDKSNSNAKSIELDANKTSGSLDQLASEVSLSKTNSKIIYEYKFTNLSTTIPATIGQLVENGSVVVPKDSNNNVKLTYTSSSSSLGAGASSDATTLNTQGLPAGTTRYVYVIVSIVELLNDVDFEGTFGWDLAKGEAITSNTTGGSQSIVVDTTDVKLYNKSAMENIQLVVGVENTEPDYPMIEDKCFTGWYSDSGLNNKVEFPIIPTADTILYPKHETATSDLTYMYESESYAVGDDTFGYQGSETDIVIPDVYDDGTNGLHPVTRISWCAFEFEEASDMVQVDINSIYMPNTITEIGEMAFYECRISSIFIPSSVTILQYTAISTCPNLTNIEVDSNNATYRSESNCIIDRATNELVYGCVNSNIPESVTSIGSSAFSDCSGLTSITIGSGVTSIGDSAFSGCSGLTSIIIPDSVTSISDSAFSGCSGLTSITISNSVTSIGSYAFDGCSGLTSITVSSGNTVYRSEGNCIIEKSSNTLILGCKNSIIPSGVISIGMNAFFDCSGLTSITIPDSVTSIGENVFRNCSGLTSITIGSGVTSIGISAFSYCSGLTSITIPDSVTSIEYSAFSDCSGLTSITIGSGVKHIGNNAFSNCSKLTSATFKNTTGWTVTTSSTATTGTAVTISTTDLAANATLLKTTHVSKYWNRA